MTNIAPGYFIKQYISPNFCKIEWNSSGGLFTKLKLKLNLNLNLVKTKFKCYDDM